MSVTGGTLEAFEPRARRYIDDHCPDDGTDDDNIASSILKSTMKNTAPQNSRKNKIDECWIIRKIECGEEELYAKGKFVYWTKGAGPMSVILKTFNFRELVLKTFWCKFAKKDHICVVVASGLHIFDKFGYHYQVPLPFAFGQMYPTKLGLIIEREPDAESDPTLPILFSLLHPTHEVSPILMKPNTKNLPQQQSQQHRISNFLMPNILSVVACHDHLPLCLVYNPHESQHSLWRIRYTKTEELEDFIPIKNDSTINTLPNQSFKDSISTQASNQTSSFNMSTRGKPNHLHQSSTNNFSPKMELRSRHSMLNTLAASRLGSGGQITPDNITSSNVLSFDSPSILKNISTPNRNNSINYLRDNIEEPILPELVFEQIWTEPSSGATKAERFFTTYDFACYEYMIIVTPESKNLKIVRYEITNDKNNLAMGQSEIVDALDALHVPWLKMMLVVEPSNNLVLYSGFNRVANILLIDINTYSKPMPASPLNNTTQSGSMIPVQMSSARKRSSLGDKSLDDMLKNILEAMSPVPHAANSKSKSTNIASTDIAHLKFAVGNSIVVSDSKKQYARFTVPSFSTTSEVSRLLDSMKSLVSPDLGLLLISKWYTVRRSTLQPEYMTAKEELRLFKNWFLNCLGVAGDYFEDIDICKTANSPLEHSFVTPHKRSKKVRDPGDNVILSNVYSLFYATHLVYEDLKLNKLNWDKAHELVDLLLVLSCMLKQTSYQEYYWRNFPDLQKRYCKHKSKLENFLKNEIDKPTFFRERPPSVYNYINKIVKFHLESSESIDVETNLSLPIYPHVPNITNDVKTVISLFCEMFGINSKNALLPISPKGNIPSNTICLNSRTINRSKSNDQKVVSMLDEMGRTRDYLQALPEGIALFLWDAILNCRDDPPKNWPESCYSLIGRLDLVSLVGKGCNIDPMWNLPPPRNIPREETKSKSSSNSKPSKANYTQHNDDEVVRLLFPDDQRINEAHKMLSSDVTVEFSVVQRQSITDEESREDADKHLYLLNIRTMAMPVGRGAINLRTYSPVIGELFHVPKLNLSGWNHSGDRMMEYNHDVSVYPWPHFHNGVGAGLTICASTSNNIIDSTWINYNRPKSDVMHGNDIRDREVATANVNNEHAGFLFALGLNGHLAKLSQMTIHDYLCQSNDLTRVAILLGLSAAKRGTCDQNVIKVLSIHVGALLPPTSTELDVPASVQVASILGVGLLYQSSCDSHISKVLLDEIGRLPGQESNSQQDRESYSMAAGLAFGLVNLCKGSSRAKVAGTSTISASNQLKQYMLGGKRTLTIAQKQRYSKQDWHRGAEDIIETHVTSPGGTLALGLMYHKSENKSVADWMKAPDTQTLLEYVRPDFLVLRMIAYGLIMWSEIEPSERWINSRIPEIVATHAFQRTSTSNGLNPVINTSRVPIDYETMAQAYCNIVSGCCMAIALRFAGSSNKCAFKTIYKHTKMFISLSSKPALSKQAGGYTIEACLNVLITSLALVMAGTGDLKVLRVCRYLRSRLMHNSIFYGSYMAVHMAIGILFLGSCRQSFSTSPEAISALVCALYPMYPNHSCDNRYHLQALRHLYVLASEPRLLIPRDIQTGKPTYALIALKQRLDHTYRKIPALEQQQQPSRDEPTLLSEGKNGFDKEEKVFLNNDNSSLDSNDDGSNDNNGEADDIVVHRLRAPCLVPEVDSILSICVDDERYWYVETGDKTALAKCLFQEGGCINVKKKAKYAPGKDESDSSSTEAERRLRQNSITAIDWASNYALLQQSGDQLVIDISNIVLQQMDLGDTHSRLTSILVQCVKEDRIERLSPLYNLLLVNSGALLRQHKAQTSGKQKALFGNLVLQQLKISNMLTELLSRHTASKMNLFKPILNLLDEKLGSSSKLFDAWIKYASKKSDWTCTSENVVQYMTLRDMRVDEEDVAEFDEDFLKSLRDILLDIEELENMSNKK